MSGQPGQNGGDAWQIPPGGIRLPQSTAVHISEIAVCRTSEIAKLRVPPNEGWRLHGQ